MTSEIISSHIETAKKRANGLKFLHPDQIAMIDEALCQLGQFGEVRIVVEKGRLRFLVVQKSIDALKWRPGSISPEIMDADDGE